MSEENLDSKILKKGIGDDLVGEFTKKSDEIKQPEKINFPIEFFSQHSRTTTKLVKKDDDAFNMKARKQWFPLSLSNPRFVSTIEIHTTGYASYESIELEYVSLATGVKNKKSDIENNVARFEIDEFVESFKFRPPSSFLIQAFIERVVVRGFVDDEINEALQSLDDLRSVSDAIFSECETRISETAQKESEHASILEGVQDAKKLRDQISIDISNLNKQLSELATKKNNTESLIAQLRADELSVRNNIQSVENALDERNQERTEINTEISKGQGDLRRLQNDVNAFSTELSNYNEQSGKDTFWYSIYLVLPLSVMLWLTYRLVVNSESLIAIGNSETYNDVFQILLTRAPYVIVSLAIIGLCLKSIKTLLNQIFEINDKKQDLHKVSIIASDVSDASLFGLEIDDERVAHIRARHKMEVLKEHMKTHIRSEYEYAIPEQTKPETDDNIPSQERAESVSPENDTSAKEETV